MEGDCQIQQGADFAQARQAVVWLARGDPANLERSRLTAYLEGDVAVAVGKPHAPTRLSDTVWLGHFETVHEVQLRTPRLTGPPSVKPAIYDRAILARQQQAGEAVQLAQFTGPMDPAPRVGGLAPPGSAAEPADALAPAGNAVPSGTTGAAAPQRARRIRAFPRGDLPAKVQWFPDRQTNQWIAVIEGGVNLIVEDLPVPSGGELAPGLGLPSLVSFDVAADRMVIWTVGVEELDLAGGKLQPGQLPLEIYMEGNIVFRQGQRVLHAERMYYDVNHQLGTVLGAELLTPVPRYEGLLRFKAEILRQIGQDRFVANNAFVTSSRLGIPGYRLQAASVYLEDIQQPRLDPLTGQPVINPLTHEPELEHRRLATSEHNFLFLDDLPVFYWPRMATDLEDASYYVRRVRLKHDSVYGLQALTDWNMYQLLGMRNRPEGTDWGLSLDWLSQRGFGHGTTLSYRREGLLGFSGPAAGLIDYWGILDHGTDNLGRDRRDVPPERDYRYRLFLQHRQMLEGDIQFSAEVGWISDRNFLEQYFEREWDELKDQRTAMELKRIRDNSSWSLLAAVRINDFFTQTDWLPRLDHFWLGQPVLGGVLTWFEHSSLGYAQLHTATLPNAAQEPDPATRSRYLPWEISSSVPPEALGTQSERFVTRQEIDWPVQLGPIKVVPYLLGEAGHWGEALDGHDLQRLYAQAGLRASIPFWRASPGVENVLWNVHGLAHKVVFEAEAGWADANRDLAELPLYEPLDDDAIEAFRRRFVPYTFPAPAVPAPLPAIPPRFDERYYALRTGMAGWVTAPSLEIADDLLFVRLGMKHRWQTKRGSPQSQRIVDWITLESNLTLFPEKDRDNFGQLVGLLDYDARWQVGDRLALVSSGIFDFFQHGQRLLSVGGFLDRPPRGGLYLGLHLLEGPIHNTILAMSYSYRMSPKWVSAFGMSIDLQDQGNIGQNFSITRVGESLLIGAGVSYDASRGNWGAGLSVEPRFLPKTRLGQAAGARIPPAGAYGLE